MQRICRCETGRNPRDPCIYTKIPTIRPPAAPTDHRSPGRETPDCHCGTSSCPENRSRRNAECRYVAVSIFVCVTEPAVRVVVSVYKVRQPVRIRGAIVHYAPKIRGLKQLNGFVQIGDTAPFLFRRHSRDFGHFRSSITRASKGIQRRPVHARINFCFKSY